MVSFIQAFPSYTLEMVLDMPWHRFVTMQCALKPTWFPERFERIVSGNTAPGKLSEAERYLEEYQRTLDRRAQHQREVDGG